MGLLAIGRTYCGALSVLAAAVVWAAWRQHSANVYLLGLLSGLSLSMATGVIGRGSRVAALAILGALCGSMAFLIDIGTSLFVDRSFGPGFAVLIVPIVEFAVALAGAMLARHLIDADVR